MRFCDETVVMQVGVALQEALRNAMQHGNLGLGLEVREMDADALAAVVEERSRTPPFCHRRVHVTAEVSRSRAVYVVRDEGEGFDATALPSPTDPVNLEKVTGRGLCLIHAFMDEVHHEGVGNQITMIKRSDE